MKNININYLLCQVVDLVVHPEEEGGDVINLPVHAAGASATLKKIYFSSSSKI